MTQNELLEYLQIAPEKVVWPIGLGGYGHSIFTFHNIRISHGFGFEVEEAARDLLKIKPYPFQSIAEIDQYFSERPFDFSLLDDELEAIRKDADADTVVFGGSFGPLTVTSDIFGMYNTLIMSRKKPKLLKRVLQHVMKFMGELAKQEVEAGAELFWIAEPVASLFSPASLRELCFEEYQEFFSDLPVCGCLHVCGNTDPHNLLFEEMGAGMISIDYLTDIKKCLETVSDQTIVMGNMSPILLRDGCFEEIREASLQLMRDIENYPNTIVSSGCMICPGTKAENIECWVETCKERKLVRWQQ